MPPSLARLSHGVIAANVHAVPAGAISCSCRSERQAAAWLRRAGSNRRVHILRMVSLDAGSLASLVAAGDLRVSSETFSDIYDATPTLPGLAAAAPRVSDLVGHIASVVLQLTGVLGIDFAEYRRSVGTHIDHLPARGAGFYNDVGRHGSCCLFWLLALDLAQGDLVMPHAGVCLALAQVTCWCLSTRTTRAGSSALVGDSARGPRKPGNGRHCRISVT